MAQTASHPKQGAGEDLAGDEISAQLEVYRRELTGYCYRLLGGTFDADGMLFVNGQSWAHVLDAAAAAAGLRRERLLDELEREVLDGRRSPHGVLLP